LIQQANNLAVKGDWESAYNKLMQASGFEPNHPGVINGLGMCLMQTGKPKEAINYFEKLVGLVPDPQEAYCSLGIAYASINELALGEEAYLKVLQTNPKNIAALKGLAVIYLQQAVRFGEGIQILRSLVKTYPDDLEAVLMLANCYEQGKNNSAAKKLYQQALEKQPGNLVAREGLMRVGGLEKV
jgi:tetratricopeptide (TPR) repeat protein